MPVYLAGIDESQLVRKPIRIGEEFLGKVAAEGTSLYLSSRAQIKAYVEVRPESLSVDSFIAVPVRHRDKTFGVLTCCNMDKITLNGSELYFVE